MDGPGVLRRGGEVPPGRRGGAEVRGWEGEAESYCM